MVAGSVAVVVAGAGAVAVASESDEVRPCSASDYPMTCWSSVQPRLNVKADLH